MRFFDVRLAVGFNQCHGRSTFTRVTQVQGSSSPCRGPGSLLAREVHDTGWLMMSCIILPSCWLPGRYLSGAEIGICELA